MRRLIRSLALLASLLAGTSHASTADALIDRLVAMQSFAASFEQRIENEFGQVLEESSGMLHLRRPRDLVWQTHAPFPLIVSTSETSVFIYDQDLAQVTELGLDEVLVGTPAGIILTAGDQLETTFEVIESGASTYSLIPLDEDAEFMRVDMAFDSVGLVALTVEDSLANRTSVRFSDRSTNEPIADDVFEVNFPDGVDRVKR